MNKTAKRKKTAELLKDLAMYRSYAKYYNELLLSEKITEAQRRTAIYRAEHYSNMINSINNALALLTETERNIINLLFFEPSNDLFDVCEAVSLERSRVYYYRATALDKIAQAILPMSR